MPLNALLTIRKKKPEATVPKMPMPADAALDTSSSTRRSMREAVDRLERSIVSIRIVPALMIVAALWWGQALLVPLAFSILISYALEPAVAQLESWRVPRVIGAPMLMAVLIGGTAGGAYLVRGQVIAFGERLPSAVHEVAQAIHRTRSDAPGAVAKMQQAAQELEQAAAANRSSRANDGVTPVRIEEPTFKWSDWLWQGSHGLVAVLGQLVAVVCLVFALLAGGDMYKRKIVRIVGPTLSDKKTTVQILADINRQIAAFLWARVVISAAVGVAVWVVFGVLGLEEPAVWGILAALLFTVPIVGPLLMVLGAGVAGFLHSGSMGLAVAAAGLTSLIGIIEGYVLTPLLMSRVGEMNAAAVFVSLMFWGWIWGIWGLLLAVPITAAIKAVCDRVDNFNAFAELLKAETGGSHE